MEWILIKTNNGWLELKKQILVEYAGDILEREEHVETVREEILDFIKYQYYNKNNKLQLWTKYL